MTPSQALAPAYTCQICRKTLMLKGPPIIGETPQQRLEKVVQMLITHMGNEHKDKLVNMMLAGQQYAGWIAGEQYTHNDAELATEANKVRLKMRQVTKRVQVSDEMIEAQVDAHLGVESVHTSSSRAIVITLLKTMRDSLDEMQPA